VRLEQENTTMHVITDAASLARALDQPLPPGLAQLLRARAELIDLTTLVVVEAGDTIDAIEAAAGVPVATNIVDGSRWADPDFEPSFEWAEDHGGVFELLFVLTDDGGGVALFVPDQQGVDPTLLAIARRYAEPAAADRTMSAQAGPPAGR
jgi:hypothetical protein